MGLVKIRKIYKKRQKPHTSALSSRMNMSLVWFLLAVFRVEVGVLYARNLIGNIHYSIINVYYHRVYYISCKLIIIN